MKHSNNDSYWNQERDKASEKKADNNEDEMIGLEARDHNKIFWIEQRLNVSREEAIRIFNNSLL